MKDATTKAERIIRGALMLAGLGAVVWGFCQIYPPAAAIVAGGLVWWECR